MCARTLKSSTIVISKPKPNIHITNTHSRQTTPWPFWQGHSDHIREAVKIWSEARCRSWPWGNSRCSPAWHRCCWQPWVRRTLSTLQRWVPAEAGQSASQAPFPWQPGWCWPPGARPVAGSDLRQGDSQTSPACLQTDNNNARRHLT